MIRVLGPADNMAEESQCGLIPTGSGFDSLACLGEAVVWGRGEAISCSLIRSHQSHGPMNNKTDSRLIVIDNYFYDNPI